MAISRLQAGTGRSDITPAANIPNGMWMAQRHVRAEGIHQPLWLTALALQSEEGTVLILDIDWCLLSNRQDQQLRQAVHEATGVPRERVLPLCTHNHAGPVTQDGYRGEGADEVHAYVASLPGAAQVAAREAIASLEPIRVAAGSGQSDIGLNRNLPTSTGRIVAGPNPAGEADDTVGVLRLERLDGTPKAILVNYACHPTVLGPGNRLVSPDYPGTTKRVVEEQIGAPCLFLQGAAGDMGPRITFVDDAGAAEHLGRLLGLEAVRVALSLDARPVQSVFSGVIESGAPLAQFVETPIPESPSRLGFARTIVQLPLRRPLPDVLAQAPERLAEWTAILDQRKREGSDTEAISEANQFVERERLRSERAAMYLASETFPVEVAAIHLGHVALAFSWGEPYSRIGRRIRDEGGDHQPTLYAGYLGGDPLYIVPADGYESPQPFQLDNCPFREETADILIAAVRDVLQQAQAA